MIVCAAPTLEGSLAARDCKLSYSRGGRKLAVAVVHCDLGGLRCKVEFECMLAAEMRTGGACAHSNLALDTMTQMAVNKGSREV